MLGLAVSAAAAALLCVAARHQRSQRLQAEASDMIYRGTVVQARKVHGYAMGDPTYWYEAQIVFTDAAGVEHTVPNTPLSGWTPRVGASVDVLHVPGQPEATKILQEEHAGERWICFGAGFFLLIGCFLAAAD